jgi:L-asparaginase
MALYNDTTGHGLRLSKHLGAVLTGGTISTISQPQGLHLSSTAALALLPKLERLAVVSPINRLSEDMQPDDWVIIAKSVRSLWSQGAAGVVVLHGTDTMAYTAAALSYLLVDLPIPVVLTGSNLAPDVPNSDSMTNVSDALIAADSLPPGVYISFAGTAGGTSYIILGTFARKLRVDGHSFVSVGRPLVGTVYQGQCTITSPPIWNNKNTISFHPKLAVDSRVLVVSLYPGCPLDSLTDFVINNAFRGVLITTYPSGTGPITSRNNSLITLTSSCVKRGIIVAGATEGELPSSLGEYPSTIEFTKAGGLFLNIPPEAATAKLMWSLGQSDEVDVVRRLLDQPVGPI